MQEEGLTKVEDTNEEALASKISAIKKGYFCDNYAEQFTQYRGKRDIIIHRGYWARVHIVKRLVEDMIANGSSVQIVSLGCGLETLWFNLREEQKAKNKYRFIEVDLESVVKKKVKKIINSKKISKLFEQNNLKPEIGQNNKTLSVGDEYLLTVCDLSNPQNLAKLIDGHKIDTSIPTFFYCECVLSYINADRVDQLMGFIGKTFDLAFMFDYEMYNPHDRFGEMMVKNFKWKGCPLDGIFKYPKLEDQSARYKHAGFQNTEVFTMLQVYNDCIEAEHRNKIQKIELLDELEEWNLIMAHYFGLLSVCYNQKGEQHPDFKALTQNVKLKRN